MDFLEITKKFGISEIFSVDELKAGHINKTYLINNKYVLQSVNSDIFQNPEIIMNNISIIEKAFESEKTVSVPHYLKCNDKNYIIYNNTLWRMCGYIPCKENYPDKNYYYGYAVGRFINIVNSTDYIFETPLDLHSGFDILNLPLRNIHGDTKKDNIIFGEKIAIIDFDTSMRGYVMSDYGDMIRSVTTDCVDFHVIREVTRGFADGLDGILTNNEINNLYCGIIFIISELMERYLHGNKNFPNKTSEQCQERAEQLTLQLESIYNSEAEITKIIDECFNMVE